MTLIEKALTLAIVLQVLLTLGILVWMGFERVPRVARGEIAVADIAVDRQAYPLQARLLSNSFDNQFQLPVLFYVAALLALWAGAGIGGEARVGGQPGRTTGDDRRDGSQAQGPDQLFTPMHADHSTDAGAQFART